MTDKATSDALPTNESNQFPENLLWHYTDFDGLYGIIKDGVMRATNISYLSDADEFRYAVKLATKVLREVLNEVSGPNAGYSAEAAFKFVQPIIASDMATLARCSYVSSFSAKGDDPSQWRGCASSRPGFAVGFDPAEMIALGVNLVACQYHVEEEIRGTIKNPVQAFADKNSPDGMDQYNFYNQLLLNYAHQVSQLALRSKSPKFEDEQETRVVIFAKPQQEIKFRKARCLITPYIEWDVHKKDCKGSSPIKCVIVGPSRHQPQIVEATKMMCQQYTGHNNVVPFTIAYRS